jgi:hypothetical protein
LHALDRTGTGIDVGLAGTFFLRGALPDDVCGVIVLEARGLQLFYAPDGLMGWRTGREEGEHEESGWRVYG